jgi:hypothetical protein
MEEIEHFDIEEDFVNYDEYGILEDKYVFPIEPALPPQPIYVLRELRHLTAYDLMRMYGHKIVISAVLNSKNPDTYQSFGILTSGYMRSNDEGNYKLILHFADSPHVEEIEGKGFERHIIEVF